MTRRFDPADPRGLPLTVCVLLGAICTLAFAVMAQDVVARDGIARADPRLMSFVVAHRVGWATSVAQWSTWVGSSFLLIPLILVVGGYVRAKHHTWTPLVLLAVSLGGAIALYNAGKALFDQPRPPGRMRIGDPVPGGSFPSGHTAEAIAVWGMLAILAAGTMTRRRWLPVAGATLVVLLVGVLRIYLGTHWLSDVLGGYALGGAWLSVVVAVTLVRRSSSRASGARSPLPSIREGG